MSRNQLKPWIVVLVCCALAMFLAWRAAHLSTKAADEATASQASASAAQVDDAEYVSKDVESSSPEEVQPLVIEGDTDEFAVSDDDYVDETPAFVMPEGAAYEPDVTLISLAEGVTVEQVNALLAETDAIATKEVTEEEIASGYLLVEVAEGYTVEEAVNAVLGAEPIEAAQPNYIYYALAGDGDDLRQLLDAEDEHEMEALWASGVEGDPEETGDDSAQGQTDPSEPTDGSQTTEPTEGITVAPPDDPSGLGDEGEGTDVAPAEPTGETTEETSATDPTTPVADDVADTTEDTDLDEASSENPENLEAVKGEGEEITLQAQLDVDDPYSSSTSSKQWALSSIKAFGAWSVARCEGTVGVAVMDQLPDADHEDLAANVVATYDAYGGSDTLTEPTEHGTHVAGIIAGVAQNGVGVAGVSYNANLVLINVFKSRLTTTTKDLLAAYSYVKGCATSLNVRVINLSVGAPIPAYDQRLIDAIDDAYTNYGIVTVAAAGNSPYTMTVSGVTTTYTAPYQQYPGDADNVVSVINLRKSGTSVVRNSDSNYNVPGETCKNISAPGANIWSTTPGNHYGTLTGTSMAAPHVAGVLALEFAANPDLTAEEAVSILYGSAADIGDEGWDEQYGYGEVDALAAVTSANPFLGAEVLLDPISFTYSGEPCKPDVTVQINGETLSVGSDYTVVYANNVNAGDGTVTITGAGEYRGFASATFTIARAQLSKDNVTLSATSLPYTGKALKPSVTVKVGTTTLVQGTDYSLSYKNNVAVGKATATVKGIGNYQGTVTKNFSIVLPDLSEATIDALPKQKYTGFAHTPNPVVHMGSKTLVLGRDYTLTYKNNIKAGTATVTIKGKSGYTGTRTLQFSIKKYTGVWKRTGSHWWYRWSDGTWPESQFVKLDGKTYWFDDSGYMATGWRKIGSSWYYFSSSGALTTGWQKVGGSWYYLDMTTGKMATGWLKIGNARYWFSSSGAMATGWKKVGNNWYYFADSGAMAKNRWVGNYYLGSDGAMLRSTVTPDGYRVDANGKWDGRGKVAA